MLKKISLTATYWIAFSILGLWASFAFYTMHSLIESQKVYGKLINLSGKQRMLSQKIVLHAHLALNDLSQFQQVKSLLTNMEEDNRFISSHLTSKKTDRYYFADDGLHFQVEKFFNLMQNFLKDPTNTRLNEIDLYSFELLKNLDKAVYIFERESDTVVENLKQRELYIYIGTISTLLLEALFIILPMIRLHNNYTKKLEQEVKERTKEIEIFAKIFANSKEGMIITDKNEKITNVNNAFTTITGYLKEEVVGKTPRVLSSGEQDQAYYEEMWDEVESNNIWQGEIINKRKDGKSVYENLTIMKLQDKENVNYVSVFTDISERILHQKTLQYIASHDSLTGVLNRYEIINRINHAISLTDRTDKYMVVVFIDVDNFKFINDSLGHVVGDKLLIEITKRLSSSIRESDTLSRIGGDEFVILLENLSQKGDEKEVLKKITGVFAKSILVDSKRFNMGASMGVVYYPDTHADSCTAQALLRKADLAMYEAKELGRSRVFYYDEKLEKQINAKMLVEQQLKDAIRNDELQLYLQPKVDLEHGVIYGAEALIRWIKDDEIISPMMFIPIAEESSLIKEIDIWVVNEAIHLLNDLHTRGYVDFSIALNISGRTFSDANVLEEILHIIEKSQMASFIEIEITEGILVENLSVASDHIRKIKYLGISLSLDDFGTGYSSFSYLSNLEIDTLKIDQSFIKNLKHLKQRVLVEAIISFSKRLGMKVIAEGIEIQKHYSWLKEHACHYGQGYFMSRPVPFGKFVEILEKWQDPLP